MYYVTKTYPHSLGLSACFRQHMANSHCFDPHGYPLAFRTVYGCEDENLLNNWVIDFGGLKEVKAWLCETFDHRTIVAEDDPLLGDFKKFYARAGFRPPLVVPRTGCEGFARYVFDHVKMWLDAHGHYPRVFLAAVECREHEGNGATYSNDEARVRLVA